MSKLPFGSFSRVALLISTAAAVSCSSTGDLPTEVVVATSAVHNPSGFAREDEALYWPFYDLGIGSSALKKSLVIVADGQVVPSQVVDWDGDGSKDGILTVLDFAPASTHNVSVQYSTDLLKPVASAKRTQAEISVKEGGKWVDRDDDSGLKNYEGGRFKNVPSVTPPNYYSDHSNWIRYEGPGIESDKVGYRVYLDWRNGFDIFGKSQAEPVLQLAGQDGYDSYHHQQPWGMDILKVGSSLGAGGFGFWENDAVTGLKDVASRSATIVENGNLFSGVRIDYNGWQVNSKAVDVNAYITMDAGSRMVYIEGPTDIPSDSYTYVATWGQQSLAGDNLGLAVFVKKRDLKSIKFDGKSRIALIRAAEGKADYYFTAAWQGELGNKGINSIDAFKQYLQEQAQKLTRPLRQDFYTTLTKAVTEKPQV